MTIKEFAKKYDLTYNAVLCCSYQIPYRLLSGTKARDYDEEALYEAVRQDTQRMWEESVRREDMLRERLDRMCETFNARD